MSSCCFSPLLCLPDFVSSDLALVLALRGFSTVSQKLQFSDTCCFFFFFFFCSLGQTHLSSLFSLFLGPSHKFQTDTSRIRGRNLVCL